MILPIQHIEIESQLYYLKDLDVVCRDPNLDKRKRNAETVVCWKNKLHKHAYHLILEQITSHIELERIQWYTCHHWQRERVHCIMRHKLREWWLLKHIITRYLLPNNSDSFPPYKIKQFLCYKNSQYAGKQLFFFSKSQLKYDPL